MLQPPPASARIMLVDDHPAVRQGLSIILASKNHTVVAEAKDRANAMELLGTCECDLVLLDLTLGDESGLDLLPELEAHGVVALVYTMHDDPETINRAFRHGALGYVTKQEEPAFLFQAIDAVLSGKRFMSPDLVDILQKESSKIEAPENMLSDRERQIFDLMGKGIGNMEIAENMNISPRTVDTYFTRMINKMDFADRRELRKYAASVSR